MPAAGALVIRPPDSRYDFEASLQDHRTHAHVPESFACRPSVLDADRRGDRRRVHNSDVANNRCWAGSVLEADRHPGRKARPADRDLRDRARKHAVRCNRHDTQGAWGHARPECLNRVVRYTDAAGARTRYCRPRCFRGAAAEDQRGWSGHNLRPDCPSGQTTVRGALAHNSRPTRSRSPDERVTCRINRLSRRSGQRRIDSRRVHEAEAGFRALPL